jgi:hypothetical protein
LKSGDNVDSLAQALIDYEVMMLPHLEQEEVECLPLCRAYFAPEEIAAKVQEILAKAPKVEIGSFIKCMGVEKLRNEFMPQERIPWFVWYLVFRSRLKLFEKRFDTPVQALKDGREPKKGIFGF